MIAMLDADKILTDLRSKDIVLSVDKTGTLKASAPEGAITPKVEQAINSHKTELIELITNVAPDKFTGWPVVMIWPGYVPQAALGQSAHWRILEDGCFEAAYYDTEQLSESIQLIAFMEEARKLGGMLKEPLPTVLDEIEGDHDLVALGR